MEASVPGRVAADTNERKTKQEATAGGRTCAAGRHRVVLGLDLATTALAVELLPRAVSSLSRRLRASLVLTHYCLSFPPTP